MLNINNSIPPHDGTNTIFAGTEISDSISAMIMIHGRGASASSIIELSKLFNTDDTIFIAPQADNFTWYPYRFIEDRESNEPGITSALNIISNIVEEVKRNEISSENIYLLGFSQGACLILDYAARYQQKLGGVFAFSGGLIGKDLNKNEYKGDLKKTPVFLGCSNVDFHIPLERVDQSAEVFKQLNADVTKRIYEDIGHTIIQDEIDFVNEIISKRAVMKGI